MALIRDADRKEITRIFNAGLNSPVTLHFFTQNASPLSAPARQCETCRDTGELLAEVAAMSDKLKLEVHDLVADAEQARKFGVDKIPAIVFEGKNKGVVRYFGVPAGYEFAVLIEDLTDLSKGSTHLGSRTRQLLGELKTPVHVRVLVTPT